MIEIPYFSRDGRALEPIRIDPRLFGDQVRMRLLKEAVILLENNRRQGSHKTKTRGEVAGSNAKPFRQKGTGRARQGCTQNPIMVGGGRAHGPRPRNYFRPMPKKKRRAAVDSAWLAKLQDGEVRCVEHIQFETPRTRDAAALLKAIGISGKCLVGLDQHSEPVWKSFRNIARARIDAVGNLDARQLLDGGVIVLSRAALDRLIAARQMRLTAKAEA